MSRSLLLDTDVVVDYLCGREEAVGFVKAHAERVILSPVVIAELYAGVKGDDGQTTLDDFVSLFRVVPVTVEVAKSAGLHKRDYAKSHGIGLGDAILAATAATEHAEFATRNTKHYPMLKDLKPPYTKK